MSPSAMKKARYFANARSGVREECGGPETSFAPRFFPTLGAKFVRPSGMPKDGYLRRSHALAGARAYKAACRAALKS